MMNDTTLWITWETQRRNKELAEAFGSTYLRIDHSEYGAIKRYVLSLRRTLKSIAKEKPALVFAQCPSLVLVVVLALYLQIKKIRLVIDAHNAAFDYLKSKNPLVRFAMRFAFSRAEFSIVTNRELKDILERCGWQAEILPDKLPQIKRAPMPERFSGGDLPVVTLIASYASDEPIELFLNAFKKADVEAKLYVTGKKSRAGKLVELESDKIAFTDYLSEADYDALISNSDLLVDLTTRENCLVCGAYEAVAAGVPIILSDTAALRELFPSGTVFSANNESAYIDALRVALGNLAGLKADMDSAEGDFRKLWDERFGVVRGFFIDNVL